MLGLGQTPAAAALALALLMNAAEANDPIVVAEQQAAPAITLPPVEVVGARRWATTLIVTRFRAPSRP